MDMNISKFLSIGALDRNVNLPLTFLRAMGRMTKYPGMYLMLMVCCIYQS